MTTCDRTLPKCWKPADVLVTLRDGCKMALCFECWLEIEQDFSGLVNNVYALTENATK